MVRFGLILAAALALAGPAVAAESEAVRSERAVVSLVSNTDQVRAGEPVRLALRFWLAPGWYTYWQNPGDAGTPAELSLALPEGARAGGIDWPTPERHPTGPLMSYGYTGEVLLPVTVTPGAGPLAVEATASWLVCERICVPEEGTFRLNLPAGSPAASPQASLFAAAAARTPRPSPFEAQVAPDGRLTLRGEGLSAATVQDAWFFPATWGEIDQAAPQKVTVRDGTVELALQPGSAFAANAPLSGVVVLRDPGGQESALQVEASPGVAVAAASSGLGLAEAAGFAFLGGLLLNLMPCVFPILAMKAMAVARMSGAARGEVRAGVASYTAGVLVAFVGLAGLLLAVRAAGSAAGWGFQFQSPVFVAGIAWVLFAVGLNMSGVFTVGGGLEGAGQGLAGRRGRAGSFFTGLLAVLVATPCTAPFMGAAIAAALAAPAGVTLLVFAAMGLGLAAPYALLGVFPGAARALPRPGAWMDVLKQALAFPMYAAAAWLVWVVSQQAGSAGVLAALVGLLLVGFAGWALGLAQRGIGWGRRLGQGAAALAAVGAIAVLAGLSASPGTAALATAQAGAGAATGVATGTEPFTAARLAALRAEGRPVFVNMTAAWCVTCLINERVALSPAPVRQAFAERGIAYLKGDWTRQDPEITAFLRQHARDGVPLYVFYPAGAAKGRVLPQILTESAVLSELDPTS